MRVGRVGNVCVLSALLQENFAPLPFPSSIIQICIYVHLQASCEASNQQKEINITKVALFVRYETLCKKFYRTEFYSTLNQ